MTTEPNANPFVTRTLAGPGDAETLAVPSGPAGPLWTGVSPSPELLRPVEVKVWDAGP